MVDTTLPFDDCGDGGLILKAEFPAFIHVGLCLGIISQDLVGNATVVIGSGMVRF